MPIVFPPDIAKPPNIGIYFTKIYCPSCSLKLAGSGAAEKVAKVMHTRLLAPRFSFFVIFLFLILFLMACSQSPSPYPAQNGMRTIDSPQGGKIVFGPVQGANSHTAALISVLRSVQNSCGEAPQIGKVFRTRGSNTNAVFFTVVNHPSGNKQVAGMIIAAQSGPNQFEAAMVSDDAARFGSSVNPMLQQLFSLWHPGEAGAAPAPSSASGPFGGNQSSASSQTLPPMQRVVLPDKTASASMPNGWNVDQTSGGGGMRISGPRGEKVHINLWFFGADPNGSSVKNMRKMNMKPLRNTVIYPPNADLAKAYPEIRQRLRASQGLRPMDLRVTSVEPMQAPKGVRCVMAQGQLNADGNGMRDFIDMLCATSPDQYGSYNFQTSGTSFSPGASNLDRATALAIINSFQVDMKLVKQRADAESAPIIAAMKRKYQAQQQQWMARHQQIIRGIKQTGENARIRNNAVQKANEAQHRAWEQQQDTQGRQSRTRSDYMLDQKIVKDNYRDTHTTEWNRTADELVRHDPKRFEILEQQNYELNRDYHR
jgi:hypothetical protein